MPWNRMRGASGSLAAAGGRAIVLAAALALCPGASASSAVKPPPAPRVNPFFAPSPLPFEAPPFNLIRDSDYRPAIE